MKNIGHYEISYSKDALLLSSSWRIKSLLHIVKILLKLLDKCLKVKSIHGDMTDSA